MIAADNLLCRLERARPTRDGSSWIASCPNRAGGAHPRGDRNPSLLVTQLQDRILIYCYAGCDTHEIVSAVGLNLSDLFDVDAHKDDPNTKGPRNRWRHRAPTFNALSVLESLAIECLTVALASSLIQEHYQTILERLPEAEKLRWFDIGLSSETHDRLITAAARIDAGWRLANGQY
jgi:hypothetical protein